MPHQEEIHSKKMLKWIQINAGLLQQIDDIRKKIEQLIRERSMIPYKIPISKMPLESRYTKLYQESKHLMNIVKMICYRSETALANLIAPHFARSRDEIRALIKSIIMRQIDLFPDYRNDKL